MQEGLLLSPGTVNPFPCPSGSKCPEGCIKPIECPPLLNSNADGDDCIIASAFYGILAGGVVLIAIAVVFIVLAISCSRRKKADTTPYVSVPTPPLPQETTSGARVVVDGDIKDTDISDELHTSVIPEDDGPMYSGL